MKYQPNIDFAKKLDSTDPLKSNRDLFYIPQFNAKECRYFCGNSLGLQPKSVSDYIKQDLEDWKNFGVEGHFKAKTPWFSYHEFVTDKTAKLVGALPHEIVVMNTLSVNLHLMMTTFYRPTKKRFKIMIEGGAFPSDIYAVQSQAKLHGFKIKEAIVELWPRKGEEILRTEDIEKEIKKHGKELALVMLGGVNYYTGQAFDMQTITKAAHKVGAYAGFDLAHATGNLHMHLHDWKVDFAVWCGYKYLNSGPGGVSGVYINEKHATNTKMPRMAGWWGNDPTTRFKMESKFVAKPTAEGWQLSNAQILPLAAYRASLEIIDKAGIAQMRKKSVQLTGFLEFLLNQLLKEKGLDLFKIITPKVPDDRGCQLSLQFKKDGKKLFDFLTKKNIIADWREPDVIRVAPVPLYNSYEDVYVLYETIKAFYR